MANTTFNGPVRAENGFEQISVNATTGAVTTNLDVDSSGNVLIKTGTSSETGYMQFNSNNLKIKTSNFIFIYFFKFVYRSYMQPNLII